MFPSATTVLLAALAAVTTAQDPQYFSVQDFTASDIRVPSESHHLGFYLTVPNTIVQEGGNFGTNCEISWNGTAVPTCYTKCHSPEGDVPELFYTRIVPGSYGYAGDFALEVLEFYHDYIYTNSPTSSLDSEHFITLTFFENSSPRNDYSCSRGGQSDICIFQTGQPFNETYSTKHGAPLPTDVCAGDGQ